MAFGDSAMNRSGALLGPEALCLATLLMVLPACSGERPLADLGSTTASTTTDDNTGSTSSSVGGTFTPPLPEDCETKPTAIFGRCELPGGGDCTGIPDETRTFVPLEDGDAVRIVIGPQSAAMFVLGLRTSSMFPGHPDNPASTENPDVGIELHDSHGELVAIYTGRPAFEKSDDPPGFLQAPGLFVVVDGNGAELVDQKLMAVAEVEDKDGVTKCGHIMFVPAVAGSQ